MMASKILTCSGCCVVIQSRQYLTCSSCTLVYDLECANVSEARFLNTLTNEKRSTWVCPGCMSRQPKTGNTNTPVGAAHCSGMRHLKNMQHISPASVSDSSETDNVTTRLPPGTSTTRPLDHSYAEDTFYLDNMRTVVRDEFERIVDERLAVTISKIVTEQVAIPMYKVIADLTNRVVVLENQLTAFMIGQPTISEPGDRLTKQTRDAPTVTISEAPVIVQPIRSSAPLVTSEPTRIVNKSAIDFRNDSAAKSSQWVNATKRHPRNTAAAIVRGAAEPGSTKLEAAERRRQLHLFYVKVGTTEDQVREHLNSICADHTYVVEALNARGNYASFKLNVPSRLADDIMCPMHWPKDVCVKPWRQSFRRKNNEEQNS